MIALIEFSTEPVLLKEEAERLKLRHSPCERVGIKDSVLQRLGYGSYYEDELVKREDGYFKPIPGDKQKDGVTEELVSSYYIYSRPPEGEYVLVEKGNHLVDLVWFISNCKLKFSVIEAVKSDAPSVENISVLLQRVEEKTQRVVDMVDVVEKRTFNEKCNVHVGGGLIVTYNEVMLKEDCCTDELQNQLNMGWRIIACCVQPDSRRPDYVLGRYNPKLDVPESIEAKR